ncbi:MAG: hypothetical protein PHG35_02150 [Dehalococcoidales bacterium]|nr:hypothetical protein [Dehalococcoidales bacterium]
MDREKEAREAIAKKLYFNQERGKGYTESEIKESWRHSPLARIRFHTLATNILNIKDGSGKKYLRIEE